MNRAELKALTDAAWEKAHGSPKTRERKNGKITRPTEGEVLAGQNMAQERKAVRTESDLIVYQRLMEKAAEEKRARCQAMVSHSLEGLANTMDRWNATMGRFQAMGYEEAMTPEQYRIAVAHIALQQARKEASKRK